MIKKGYFSLWFLPSSHLLQCCVTSSVRLFQSSPWAWLPLSCVRAQPQQQHSPEDAGEKLRVPHGSTGAQKQQMPKHDISFRDMTFPLGTRLASSFMWGPLQRAAQFRDAVHSWVWQRLWGTQYKTAHSLRLVSQETLTKWRSYNLHWLSTLSTRMHPSFWFLYPNPSKFQTKESADHWHCRRHRHHLLGLCHSPSLLGEGKSSMPIKKIQIKIKLLTFLITKIRTSITNITYCCITRKQWFNGSLMIPEDVNVFFPYNFNRKATQNWPAVLLDRSQGMLILRDKCSVQSQDFFLQYAKVCNILKTWTFYRLPFNRYHVKKAK